MRVCATSVFGLLTLAAVAWTGPLVRSRAVIDAVRASYREDAPGGRVVAAVTARLVREAASLSVAVELAARGPCVVPVLGFAGVGGVNLRTAEELQRLLGERALGVTVRRGGAAVGGGEVVAVERARLPTRVLTADGDIDLRAHTPAEWPARVCLRSSPFAAPDAGERVAVDLLANGVSRLRVTVSDDGHGPRIEAVESLGDVLEVER